MDFPPANWAVVAYVLEYVAIEPEGAVPLVVTVDWEVTVYVTVSAQAALPHKHPTIIRHRDRKKRCEIVFFIIVFGYFVNYMFGCLWGRRGGRSVWARKGGAHCGQGAFGKGRNAKCRERQTQNGAAAEATV